MEADDLNLNPNLQGKKGAEHYSEAWSSNTVESQFSKPRISSAGQVLLQSLALTENQLTSAGGSQCRVSVPADALGLGLQSWVLTVAWQHGRFLTSFETNIWLAVVPKLCGAAECFCSREAAVWQRQRSHIFSHRSPPPPPPPLFFSKTVFFFYICATASCLLHGHPLGLQWFSAEYGTIPPPIHTHTHILSHSLFVFAAEGLVQGWGSKCFPGWRKLSAWWWERYKANSWDIRLGDKRKETLTLIKPCGSNTFLCLFALFLALFNNRLSVYGCF